MENKNKKIKHKNGISAYYVEKQNKWRAYITLPDGSGKRKDFYGKTRKEAEDKAQEFLNNGCRKNSNKTLAEYCQEIIDIKLASKEITEHTYLIYLSSLKRIKKYGLGNKEIRKITQDDINNYFLNKIKNLCQTVKLGDKNIMNMGFEIAEEEGIIEKNPLKSSKIKIKSNTKIQEVVSLTIEEQKKFLDVLNFSDNYEKYYPYSLAWLIAYYTGMRMGEVCALQWKDVDLENKNIWVCATISRDKNKKLFCQNFTKTKKSTRNCHIVPELYKILKEEQKYTKKYVVTRDTINFVPPNYCTVKLKKLNEENKITKNITCHMLRHTFATNLIDSGVPSHIVQQKLGHSKIERTINTYYTYFQKQNKQYDVAMDNIFAEINKENTC